VYIFFFQAEDGILYRNVTGVQTCALPISLRGFLSSRSPANFACLRWSTYASYCTPSWREPPNRGPTDRSVSTRRNDSIDFTDYRSEERRVGKEWRLLL